MTKKRPRLDRWTLSRMARILKLWMLLDSADRAFLLDKFAFDDPTAFWAVARKYQTHSRG